MYPQMAGPGDSLRRERTHRRGARYAAAALALLTFLPASAFAADPAIDREISAALASLPHPRTRVSACVVDLADGRVLFEKNADTALMPASCMKVLTMAAALRELGPGFAFETTLATDGSNLFVIGDGDPAFGDEKLHRANEAEITSDFDRWADGLRIRGVTSVAGDLVIDESVFDDTLLHPSWEPDDLGKWYAAPVGGLNFNDNCLDITVEPAAGRDAPVLVTVQPVTSLVHIINKCRSGGEGTPVLHHSPGTLEYTISGRCAKRWPFASVAFPDPGLLFAESLRTALGKKGIAIAGTVRRQRIRDPSGTIPTQLTVLAKRSTPLSDVLQRAGRDSQNLFAECLLKRTGCAWAVRAGRPDPQGSWALGGEAVFDALRRAGIPTVGLAVADGSGLSRDNACTARQLALLLAHINGQPFGDLFRDSLSVAGAEGSLRRRLKDVAGRVQAKTGTMTGVRGLAGYVSDDARPRFAFAVLFNGYSGPSTPYKKIQDEICRILVDAAMPAESAAWKGNPVPRKR